ncbi:MAG: glycosyltransferase [Rhodanobacteraceae bacterium]|nr:glycosyltransferase [Rhodanobacteraceae bacterium]
MSEVMPDRAQSGQFPPKLLFHYPILNRGGAEKSLLRLMAGLADRGCEIHLVLTSPGGLLEPEVDSRIHLHHLRRVPVIKFAPGAAWRHVVQWPLRAIRGAVARLQERAARLQFSGVKFDAAFTGITGLSPYFICKAVDAKKRFVFVRSNPEAADHKGRWASNVQAFHEQIDAYVCVSESVRDAMAKRFPVIAEKCVCIYNLLDAKAMLAKAELGQEPFHAADDRVRVLTVCRLQEASKALLRMVEVHRLLLDAGLAHEWHVLGDGPDRVLLERAIKASGVAATFKLHGAVGNPFPYYKHADICAVLSRYEGLCGVVNEARVLERPVIATRFAGIEEQIQSGVNGLVVEQDVEAICAGMASLIRDAALRERLAKGGYPHALLDDDAKVDALLRLIEVATPETAGV